MGRKNIKLEKKIKKALDEATKKVAEELTYQIEAAYEKAVDKFYEDYPNPAWYDRTFSTYLASDKYNDYYDILHVGDSYYAGINVSAGNIPGNPYRAYKHWVFDRTFRQGIHGYTYAEAKEWSSRRNNRDYGITFKFKSGMGKMKHPPKEIMDNWFKHEIMTKRGQKAIDEIFTNELTKQLNR